MDQEIRNKLRNVVTQCRKLLENSISQELEGKYGIFAKKDQVTADPNAKTTHLSEEEQAARKDILDHFGHINARGFKPKDSLDQLVREIAFTHLNRLCAYKMMEAREVYVGGQKFRETVSRGVNSNGVKFYLAEHEEDERLFNTGHQDVAYRHYLDWLGGALSDEIGVLFNPNDPANRLYPRQKTLDEVLDLLNEGGIKAEETELREQWPQIWSQDETIGWVYQYFTPKELRDQARKESSAPRNSYELAFRNQFFTPRYVVEFLTDNTLGRIWYEMRKGETKLKDQCRYMVRRPTEMFLREGEQPPKDASEGRDDLSQEEMLKLPVHIPHRPKKDPRELKILDPACGSGHFLLYCFDLLLTIYEEAYADPDLGPALKKDYPTLDALKRDVPRLILAHNLHGIDIDLRASQIAALALWLRCQRAYQEMGLKKDRPKITRSNFVCAEPMPGEEQMLKEFVGQLEPKVLGQVVEVVFDKMKLAGEAGSLLKIEEEIRDAIREAKRQYAIGGLSVQRTLFDKPTEPVVKVFSVKDITDAQFFEGAEAQVIEALRSYAENAQDGQRLQRRLFSEDAVSGFAFVDLCQKRYDVVLMNPPFGSFPANADSILNRYFPDCRGDCYPSFISRWVNKTTFLGAITNRTGLSLGGLADWRRDTLLGNPGLTLLADLGLGVLDALVETAAYVIGPCTHNSLFIDYLSIPSTSIEPVLLKDIEDCRGNIPSRRLAYKPLGIFGALPDCPIAFRPPISLLARFRQFRAAERDGLVFRVTSPNYDDFRYLRLRWEVPSNEIGRSRRWSPIAKGGEYEPFYADIHLVIDWDDSAGTFRGFTGTVHRPLARPACANLFFTGGVTWSERTASRFSPRILPRGTIFSSVGPFCGGLNDDSMLAVLAILSSSTFQSFLELFLAAGDATSSGTAARHYQVGALRKLPLPELSEVTTLQLRDAVLRIIHRFQRSSSRDETSALFCGLGRYWTKVRSLAELDSINCADYANDVYATLQDSLQLENVVASAYTLTPAERQFVDKAVGPHPLEYATSLGITDEVRGMLESSVENVIGEAVKAGKTGRFITVKSHYADRHVEVVSHVLESSPVDWKDAFVQFGLLGRDTKKSAAELLSIAVGIACGRWSMDRLFDDSESAVSNPFDELPPAPPAASDILAAADEGADESCSIFVDDPNHSDDIVRRVQRVCESIWKERADAIEKEACEILGVKELREYFRKPSNGGFWDDHISRYSKSRRKAPIYWLLQSTKKNYALWLYYHRLDKDLLFKALVNYVEPKIRLETSRLESLRSQKSAAGESGKEAKRLAKEVERQEEFLSELRDFEDKLRRAANLNLEPDLNDGVVLNIAPLWELVPWKEAKSYWDELLKGEYEWSSIGKQLRQKGLVK